MWRSERLSTRNLGQRNVPTFAEDRLYEVVGLLAIGEAEVGGVPLEFARDANRDRSQDKPFGIWAGNAEIGTGRGAPFASANPIAAMSGVVAARVRAR